MHWRGFRLSPPTIQRSQHLEKKIQKFPPRRLISPNGIASQHLFISAVTAPFQQAFPFFYHRRSIERLLVNLLTVVAPSLSPIHCASGGFPPSSPLHRMSFRLSFSTYRRCFILISSMISTLRNSFSYSDFSFLLIFAGERATCLC